MNSRRSAGWTCLIMALGCASSEDGGEALASPGGPHSLNVVSLVPGFSIRDTTVTLRVLGTGFEADATVEFLLGDQADSGVVATAVRYVSRTELRVNVRVAAEATPSFHRVVVTSRGRKGIATEERGWLAVLEAAMLPGDQAQVAFDGVSSDGRIAGSARGSCGGSSPVVWGRDAQISYLPEAPCPGSASGVNTSGVVVGGDATGAVLIRWTPAGPGGYTTLRLPIPSPGLWTDVGPGLKAVNTAGGIITTRETFLWREAEGWRWARWPGLVDLPTKTLTSHDICRLTALNASGEMVGGCSGSLYPGAYWKSISDTGQYLPGPPGAHNVSPQDINDAGVIVGRMMIPSATPGAVPVRWTPSGDGWTVEMLPDLGAGGVAYSINATGEIAGSVVDAGANGRARPALWTSDGFLLVLETDEDAIGEAVGLSDMDARGLLIAGHLWAGGSSGERVAVLWRLKSLSVALSR